MRGSLLLLLSLGIASPLNAAVTINEIAWMGSPESANHEWIELHNDGSEVDLTGWKLVDDKNLEINLEGKIGANKYVVLERSSDASSPGAAFLIYTGSLVNTGATLRLLRADGSIEDQVAGGEDWKNVGGDNTTKETAQYITSGWITADPTPGNTNKTESSVQSETGSSLSSGAASGRVKSIVSSETVKLGESGGELQLQITAQQVGYVNQEIEFIAEPSGVGRAIENSLVYEWNYGDGSVALGKEVIHQYRFPGTYVAVLYASYKEQKQLVRHEITILPVQISLTRNAQGDLQINNDSPYEIDISDFVVEASKRFVFAARSIMLPNQTVTISGKTIGGTARVYDAAGVLVVTEAAVSTGSRSNQPASMSTMEADEGVSVSRVVPKNERFTFADVDAPETESLPEEVISITASNSDPVVPPKSSSWQYVALLSLIGLVILGIVYRPNAV